MKLTAVCISDMKRDLALPIRFYCHTDGYNPKIQGHDNLDRERLEYITDRYNVAIRKALMFHPETEHVLLIDSYYLGYGPEITRLIQDYQYDMILGASIWYWSRFEILPAIRYYDTLSVNEFRGWKWKWRNIKDLPTGIISVSGVGGCWIFPRQVWETSGGFSIPQKEPQAGGSKCLRTESLKIRLDCNSRLWRSPNTNPGLQGYPWPKRVRVSLGEQKNKVLRALRVRVPDDKRENGKERA